MKHNPIETIIGGIALLVALFFVVFAFNKADLRAPSGITVTAKFNKAGGIITGSDVRVNGIKVGAVRNIWLNENYEAMISMVIKDSVRLPDDSTAIIASEGIIGGKHLRIIPGTSTNFLANGGNISRTRDFRSLEDTVGDLIFQVTGAGGGGAH
ncbi:MAG: MlaD family protein [Alphaproteobacteria bacterium]|nr:MlaD family protein [Alphaproteobacteria bacterium]